MGLLSGSSQLTTGRLPAEEALLHRIPYHATLAGTGGDRWQRIPLVQAAFRLPEGCSLAARCPLIFPRPFHPLLPKWTFAFAELATVGVGTPTSLRDLPLLCSRWGRRGVAAPVAGLALYRRLRGCG